ncbi:uncharacterized protein LOC110179596 [Drosophila serrata]|uniref:uncharacterized protein LOC110179596 n=1 Tax=Drosophila serrata TaxID=7274 RepID=UPI000A1CF591|nr:uncharacterized protein LOC110179596 [Drosophila serrata]
MRLAMSLAQLCDLSSKQALSSRGPIAQWESLIKNPIERDTEGRLLRWGYVPVEHKIQEELQEPKSREKELKRMRKINRQNTLKASLEKLQHNTDDKADADDDDEEDSAIAPENCDMPSPPRSWIEMATNWRPYTSPLAFAA